MKVGARHADVVRLARHQAREVLLRAGDVLGERDGDVVGGFGHQRLHGIEHGDLGAGLDLELGGCGVGALLRHLDLRRVVEPPELDQLERHVERHHLGERGRIARLVAGLIVQHGTRIGVDRHGGVARQQPLLAGLERPTQATRQSSAAAALELRKGCRNISAASIPRLNLRPSAKLKNAYASIDCTDALAKRCCCGGKPQRSIVFGLHWGASCAPFRESQRALNFGRVNARACSPRAWCIAKRP